VVRATKFGFAGGRHFDRDAPARRVPLTRRRHLHALSRFADTPPRLVVELNADATDYVQVVETAPDEFERYFLAALVRAAILAS
jgi:hypothetical protein